MGRQSGEGIVYSAIDVKKWAAEIPSVEAVRPACCSRCGAASRPAGAGIVLIGHGGRERQIRGPAGHRGEPEIRVIIVRRYRCRLCGGLTTVLPRGLTARRHYSASAIGLSLCLYGLQRLSMGATRRRVCAWRVSVDSERWTTLPGWVAAIQQGRLFTGIRPCPTAFTARDCAERAAATLCSLAITAGPLDAQAFDGAAHAA
jgi:hypothetical protein